MNLKGHFACLMMALAITSCSQELVVNEEVGLATLTFNVSPYEKTPMDASTRAVAAKDAVSRISLALFKDGNAVISPERAPKLLISANILEINLQS